MQSDVADPWKWHAGHFLMSCTHIIDHHRMLFSPVGLVILLPIPGKGDSILKVNGVTGDVAAMLDRCKTDMELEP